jgi:hypothetical protein
MTIGIPKVHHDPLRQLIELPQEDYARLLRSVQGAEATIGSDELISQLRAKSGLGDKTEPIVRMLLSMKRASASSRGNFAKQVSREARKLYGEPQAVEGGLNAIEGRLTELLSCDHSLGVTAKVLDVRGDHGCVFCNARILTDIRAVFGEDPTRSPVAGTVIHSLRIEYHDVDDHHRRFYVALDGDDLRILRGLIDRAIKKESALKQEIVKTSMKYLEVEVDQ